MGTLRHLVSAVRSMHRLLSTDNSITDRVVASEIRSNSLLLIKRELNLRKLWNTDTVFTTLPCVEMEEVSISECCDYAEECTIARSKFKIPRISEGNYQYVIQGVYSINALGGKGKKVKEITVNRYLNLLKLPFTKKEEYFWISDGYLYITNPMVEKVRLVALFEEDIPNELRYSDCACSKYPVTDEEWCKNPLDREFYLPGYLEKQVLELTSQKLLQTYFRVKEDISENGVDASAPNVNEAGK